MQQQWLPIRPIDRRGVSKSCARTCFTGWGLPVGLRPARLSLLLEPLTAELIVQRVVAMRRLRLAYGAHLFDDVSEVLNGEGVLVTEAVDDTTRPEEF